MQNKLNQVRTTKEVHPLRVLNPPKALSLLKEVDYPREAKMKKL
jgi:hypothetical protein